MPQSKHSRHLGNWATPGVPHKGWSCDEIIDNEEPSSTCEMCQVAAIRFVHIMSHPHYPDTLRCGCVCAGHMEEDLAAAKERESVSKRTSRRVESGLMAHWKISKKGNLYFKTKSCVITVFEKKGRWGSCVYDCDLDRTEFSDTPSPSAYQAKRSGLLIASKIIERRRSQEGI